MIINAILKNQTIWNLSQIVLGANNQKMDLYSSVIDLKGKILDFGCANGNTFEAFKDYDYTGVDIDSSCINFANSKYENYKNARFICDDITNDNLDKESFDSILFAGTGHHINNKLLFKITKSLSRLLKKGGSLYFIDTIRDKKRKSKLLSLLISLDQGKFHRTEYIYNHILDKFAPELVPIYHKTHQMKGTFVPQPTYYVAKLTKK
jgi:SAM-dependent methyltransferase